MQDESIFLQAADFPDYFIDKHHPEDYIMTELPIEKECIFNELVDHNRCILRISFKFKEGFIPFTFICDTGAPSSIYLNDITRRMLITRLLKDDLGNLFLRINGKRMAVKPSPEPHSDTNIFGVLALRSFGFHFDEATFNFNNLPDYI